MLIVSALSGAGVPKLFHSMTHLDKYNLFQDPPKYLRLKKTIDITISLILIKSIIWQENNLFIL